MQIYSVGDYSPISEMDSRISNSVYRGPEDLVTLLIDSTIIKSNGKGSGLLEKEGTRDFLKRYLTDKNPDEFGLDLEESVRISKIKERMQPYIQFAADPLGNKFYGFKGEIETLEEKAREVMKDYDPNKISVFNYLTIIMQQDLTSRINNKD